MINLKNEMLAKHTTFKIGGPAELFIVPETEAELISIFKYFREKATKVHILGNGSNLLVSDKGVKGCVIHMARCCQSLESVDGLVYAGASVRIQEFIRFAINQGYGGCEYLYSVPATVGGAIYTNAGRGRQHNQQISDYVMDVKIFNGKECRYLDKIECQFAYRESVFHKRKDWLILGVRFNLPRQAKEIGESKMSERLRYVQSCQDNGLPTAGSVFKDSRNIILRLLRGIRFGGARYSLKTANWINNCRNATALDVMVLIRIAQTLNWITLKRPKLEIEFWD